MSTATKSKWFYEHQKPMQEAIEKIYEIRGYIVSQIYDKDHYVECWNVKRKDNGLLTQIVVTVYRRFAIQTYNIYEKQYH